MKLLRNVMVFLSAIVMICSGSILISDYSSIRNSIEKTEEMIRDEQSFRKNEWMALYEKNHDFAAFLSFENRLIELPVMCGRKYLEVGFTEERQIGGLPYIESDTSFLDQIITIYGHSVFTYTDDLVFTKLNTLHNQEVFEENRIIRVFLSDRIVQYEIIAVDLADPLKEFTAHDLSSFKDEKTFEEWWQCVRRYSSVTSDIVPTSKDSYLVLQTCHGYQTPEVTFVIARKIAEEGYGENIYETG